MSSDNYTETRPRIRVTESARRELRSFKEEYDLPLDRVYGFAFERMAEEIEQSHSDEFAEAIKTNE